MSIFHTIIKLDFIVYGSKQQPVKADVRIPCVKSNFLYFTEPDTESHQFILISVRLSFASLMLKLLLALKLGYNM